MNLPDGYFLQGKKYQLTNAIGQGGFGITYLGAWNTEVKGELGKMKTKVPVCIKEYFFKDYCYRDKNSYAVKVHSETGEKLFGKFKEKLIREAKILSAVHHPYIVNVLEVFEENNTAYIIMEYIKGCSLKYMLDKEGVLNENKVLKYTHQIGNALDFVHEKNIVHLDIKPGNILIDREDNARLIDFGVSKRYDIEEQETSTTTLTLSKGFASIEQYDDEGTQNFSPCPDIYSLGATLYNLLTGVVPVESILRATKKMLPPSSYNSNISSKTETAILKAMEVKPEDRFQTVKELLASIDIPPYELAENNLTEAKYSIEDERTEVLGLKTLKPADDNEEDKTIIISSTGNNFSGTRSSSKRKKKSKALMPVVMLFCILLISLVVFYYINDITASQGVYTGIDIPDNTSFPDNGKPEEDADSSEIGTITDTPQLTPQQDTPNNYSGQNNPPQTRQETVGNSISSSQPTSSSGSVGVIANNDNNTVQNNRNILERTYQQLMTSANDKYESENYLGALDDLRNALEMVETHGVGSKDAIEPMIKLCNDKEHEKIVKERLEKYVTYIKIGELLVARDKKTLLYGAINAEGEEIIRCIYKTYESHNEGYAFNYEDGRSDIYNVKGELVDKE